MLANALGLGIFLHQHAQTLCAAIVSIRYERVDGARGRDRRRGAHLDREFQTPRPIDRESRRARPSLRPKGLSYPILALG